MLFAKGGVISAGIDDQNGLDVNPQEMKENTVMATSVVSKKISDFVEDFTNGLTKLIEDQASASFREKLKDVIGDLPAARVSVSGGTKRKYHRKPCPYPGCKENGAPRYSQFCPTHGKMLQEKGEKAFEEAVATYQAEASKPGGVWYQENKKRGRRTAAAA